MPDKMPELHIVLHDSKITLVKTKLAANQDFFPYFFFPLFKIALLIRLRSNQYLDEKSENVKSLDINDTIDIFKLKQ